jgi:hypothetical protein
MTRRRQFGTVRRVQSGRWQARYHAADGSRFPAPGTFASKAQAARWLASVETDQARGTWVDPEAGKVTFSDYAHEWLAGKPRLSPRTREIYEGQLRLHVLPSVSADVPALGTTPLGKITPELVRAWYAVLARQRGSSVAAKACTRLRQILRQAVDDDRIPKNPCRIPGGGTERHAEQRFDTLQQLYQLADAVPARY